MLPCDPTLSRFCTFANTPFVSKGHRRVELGGGVSVLVGVDGGRDGIAGSGNDGGGAEGLGSRNDGRTRACPPQVFEIGLHLVERFAAKPLQNGAIQGE